MQTNYKQTGTIVIMTVLLMILPLNESYAEKINCAEGIDLIKYPICKYEDKWNQSEQFNEKVVDEMAERANRINADPDMFYQIYLQSIEKVDRENPGLKQTCQIMKDWIYAQLENI